MCVVLAMRCASHIFSPLRLRCAPHLLPTAASVRGDRRERARPREASGAEGCVPRCAAMREVGCGPARRERCACLRPYAIEEALREEARNVVRRRARVVLALVVVLAPAFGAGRHVFKRASVIMRRWRHPCASISAWRDCEHIRTNAQCECATTLASRTHQDRRALKSQGHR